MSTAIDPARLLGLWLLLAVSSLRPALGGSRAVPPVDEAHRDPSLVEFRDRLLRAVRERDQAFVLSILHPDVTSSYGGPPGIRGFRETYFEAPVGGSSGSNGHSIKGEVQVTDGELRLTDGELRATYLEDLAAGERTRSFWTELDKALRMGGQFVTQEGRLEFCAPYTFTADIPWDSFSYVVITARDVPVRSRPEVTAPIIGRLSHEAVKMPARSFQGPRPGEPLWTWVVMPEGREGCVLSRHARGPNDYRVCLRKVGGRWLMTGFVAGD